MMDYILTASRRNLAYGTMLLEDIEDARMCDQSGTLVNHPAWIVGHIVGSYDVIAKLLQQQVLWKAESCEAIAV